MRKSILLKTNIFVCAIIIAGFLITALVSYRSNWTFFEDEVESVTSLTSEGIYQKIEAEFSKPINVSLTMAGDTLLARLLEQEESGLMEDELYVESIRQYLMSYHEKFGYESVFLASAATGRYYHYNGIDRILTPDNEENYWYYGFKETPEGFTINIDNDQADNNAITIFINCGVYGRQGELLGIVGVGFIVNHIQDMLMEYEEQFGVRAYLVDEAGYIEVSREETGFNRVALFENSAYPQLKDEILAEKNKTGSHWYGDGESRGYLVSCYVENLGWYLLIENDVTALEDTLFRQFVISLVVICVMLGLVILIITGIIRKFNRRIIRLTMEREQRHRTSFQQATEGIYENINEFDISHNCIASESTELYSRSLGISPNLPYDKWLAEVARNQIHEDYGPGYVSTFSPDNVLKAYREGTDSLQYEFPLLAEDGEYRWKRIIARIFFWEEDKSVRLFTYRQNIDEEKRKEEHIRDQMQRDSLSGLYNKAATQQKISDALESGQGKRFAFFIIDLDDFKLVNDRFGHVVGDEVLVGFSKRLKEQFRDEDIVGRVGGDEFTAFIPINSMNWLEKKVQQLSGALAQDFVGVERSRVSASIGVAVSPEGGTDFETLYKNADKALYEAKAQGKGSYVIYGAGI